LGRVQLADLGQPPPTAPLVVSIFFTSEALNLAQVSSLLSKSINLLLNLLQACFHCLSLFEHLGRFPQALLFEVVELTFAFGQDVVTPCWTRARIVISLVMQSGSCHLKGKVTGTKHLCRDNDIEVIRSASCALNACGQLSNLVAECFNIFTRCILELKGSDSLD